MDETPLPPGTDGDDPILPPSPDTFRRVVFGQLSDPLVRPHPEPPEAAEDELTRAALSDPEASLAPTPSEEPTAWRWVILLAGAATALYILFGRP